MDAVLLVATWLHTVAFVIGWGYYGVLGRIVIPGLERTLDDAGRSAALLDIERRALPLIGLSVVLFTVTGSYLLIVDPQYRGLGSFTTTWSNLMLGKHVVVIGLVGLGVATDLLIRRAAETDDEGARSSSLRLLRLCAEAATALGALIVLLTVAAQLAV